MGYGISDCIQYASILSPLLVVICVTSRNVNSNLNVSCFLSVCSIILFYRLFIVSAFVNMRRKLYVYDNDARQVSYMETVNDNRFSLLSQGRVKERKNILSRLPTDFFFKIVFSCWVTGHLYVDYQTEVLGGIIVTTST